MSTIARYALAALLVSAPLAAQDSDRIYGKVTTEKGDIYEGFIRWGGTEVGWVDLFNGTKILPDEYIRQFKELGGETEEDRPFYFLGIKLSDDDSDPRRRASAVRFGDLRSVEALNSRDARLTLKNGKQIVYRGGSNDLGRSLGDTYVEDVERGQVKLDWRDIERVDFSAVPEGRASSEGRRLYGTLTTRSGSTFEGYVTWDVDEVLPNETLDGEERGSGRDREIPFGDVASIERSGWSGSKVVLRSGEKLELTDSNDVDDDNRGIIIADPAWGQVEVSWADFQRLDFKTPAAKAGYDSFKEPRPLRGAVETESGETHRGRIRWDNDEEYTWETLDGRQGRLDFNIVFAAVASIEKHRDGSIVTLRGGQRFELEDSVDVDEDNNGIIIEKDDGQRVLVLWRDFLKAQFD